MPKKEKPFRLTPSERAICKKLSFMTLGAAPTSKVVRNNPVGVGALRGLVKLGLVKYNALADFMKLNDISDELLEGYHQFNKIPHKCTVLQLNFEMWKLLS